jgi:hypothetical protein
LVIAALLPQLDYTTPVDFWQMAVIHDEMVGDSSQALNSIG